MKHISKMLMVANSLSILSKVQMDSQKRGMTDHRHSTANLNQLSVTAWSVLFQEEL